MAVRVAEDTSRDSKWTSDELADGARLTAWNDLVSSSVAEMHIDTNTPQGFRAHWQRFGLGPIDINNFRTTQQSISRDSAMARRSREEVYALSYMHQGTAELTHNGVNIHVPERSFVLVNHAVPYNFQFPDGAFALTVHMRDSWLRRWVPQPETLLARAIDASGWGEPLAAVLLTVDQFGLEDAVLPRSVIADQIGAFLALINGNAANGNTLHQGELLERAKRVIRDRHDDPELTPSVIAKELGISRRYVHMIFAHAGTTFGAVLLEMRLLRASNLLKDSRYRAYRIGDVAYACGFSDPSHFARRFRERFQCGPSAFRQIETGALLLRGQA